MPDAATRHAFAGSASEARSDAADRARPESAAGAPSPAWAIAGGLAFAGVAVTEPLTPLGFAHGSLYLLPVLLIVRYGQPLWVIAATVAAVLATVAGTMVAPPAPEGTMSASVIGNRAASVVIVTLAGALGYASQRAARRRLRAEVDARAAAEDARRRLDAALNSITDGFYVLGPDWRFRYLNDQAVQVLRCGREALLGAVVWDAFPATVGSPVQAHYQRAVRDGTPVAFEAYYPEPLDAWFEVRAYPSDEGLAVYFRDVTERRRDQDRLRLLETAIERLNDAVVISEAHPSGEEGRRVVYVNPAFERITGWSRDEAIGGSLRALLQDGRPEGPGLRALREAYDAFRPIRTEVRNVAKDGRELRLEVDAVPFAGPDGRWTHWVAVERDVTEQRALEERVHRTRRLESIGQLTGGVARDVNNLMTVIAGASERLAERLDADPSASDLVDVIAHAAERGVGLTHSLLAFARRQPLRPRATDVHAWLDGLHALLRRTLGEDVAVHVHIAEDAPTAWVDPSELENAVLNLILNARDALPDGGNVTVRVDGHEAGAAEAERDELAPGTYLRIRVVDDGRGIAPDALPRVFEPFFTTKRSGRGSGLGLATVYGFARQSGGQATIRSTLGEGTEATLWLPTTERRPDPVLARPEGGPPPSGRSRHVLVVEDDELVRSYVADELTALGYRATAVADGASALRHLEQEAPVDLLFTDVVMPGGMDGRELAERARALRPDLPVLLTSGYADTEAEPRATSEHGARLLRKPYRRTDLARAVDEALQG